MPNNIDTLRKIQFIIDLDGFQHGSSPFYVKEMGIVDLNKWKGKLYHFALPISKDSVVDDKELVTYHRQKFHVHGLELKNNDSDLPEAFIAIIIEQIILESHFNETFIAYKGGRCEKDLLEKLSARFIVNLEHLGCPKFNALFERSDLKNIINTIRWRTSVTKRVTCGRHIQDRKHFHFHCPVEEVRHFAAWIITQR